jgi:hypothetical protein
MVAYHLQYVPSHLVQRAERQYSAPQLSRDVSLLGLHSDPGTRALVILSHYCHCCQMLARGLRQAILRYIVGCLKNEESLPSISKLHGIVLFDAIDLEFHLFLRRPQ